MIDKKKFTIITPCFNSEKFIEETIESVLNQKAVIDNSVDLEYIIYDGASNDSTNSIIERINSPFIKFYSEPDDGMYDALSKAFEKATGSIVAYLNAGDLYYRTAFNVVDHIFRSPEVKWLTGMNVYYNMQSEVYASKLPLRYKKSLILSGAYGKYLPFIQQESTFWRSELMSYVNLEELKKFKLAGDYFLWYCFAKAGFSLRIVESFLGGFRTHEGQLSTNRDEYEREKRSFISRRESGGVLTTLESILWALPNRLKKRLNREIFYYSPEQESWVTTAAFVSKS